MSFINITIPKYKKFVALIFILSFLELFFYNKNINILLPQNIFNEYGNNINFLLSQQDIKKYRIALTPVTQMIGRKTCGETVYKAFLNYQDKLFGNTNLNYGIYNFRGQDIELKNYYKFMDFVYSRKTLDDALPYFSIANVKYILSVKKQDTNFAKQIVNEKSGLAIYENPFALPLIYFVSNYVYEPDLKKSLLLLEKLKYGILNTVIIHNLGKNVPLIETGSINVKTKYKIDNIIRSTNKIKFELVTTKPGFLIVSENYYPGWECKIDNSITKIFHSNIFMKSVFVPKGQHCIEFIYNPISFKFGCVISLIAILFTLLYLFENIDYSGGEKK